MGFRVGDSRVRGRKGLKGSERLINASRFGIVSEFRVGHGTLAKFAVSAVALEAGFSNLRACRLKGLRLLGFTLNPKP